MRKEGSHATQYRCLAQLPRPQSLGTMSRYLQTNQTLALTSRCLWQEYVPLPTKGRAPLAPCLRILRPRISLNECLLFFGGSTSLPIYTPDGPANCTHARNTHLSKCLWLSLALTCLCACSQINMSSSSLCLPTGLYTPAYEFMFHPHGSPSCALGSSH